MGPEQFLETLWDDVRKRYRPIIVKTAFFQRGMIAEVFERSETAARDEERSRQRPRPPETPRGPVAFLGFLHHVGEEEIAGSVAGDVPKLSLRKRRAAVRLQTRRRRSSPGAGSALFTSFISPPFLPLLLG